MIGIAARAWPNAFGGALSTGSARQPPRAPFMASRDSLADLLARCALHDRHAFEAVSYTHLDITMRASRSRQRFKPGKAPITAAHIQSFAPCDGLVYPKITI